jgi:hypothetical protein
MPAKLQDRSNSESKSFQLSTLHGKVHLREFEARLLEMLARIEEHRSNLEEAIAQQRHGQVITLAYQLVQDIVSVAEKNLPSHLESQTATTVVQWVGEFFQSARTLLDQMPSSGIRSLFGLLERSSVNTEDRRIAYNYCLSTVPEIVQAYFTLFTGRFPSSFSARGWVEAAAIFFVDLKRVIRDGKVEAQ